MVAIKDALEPVPQRKKLRGWKLKRQGKPKSPAAREKLNA